MLRQSLFSLLSLGLATLASGAALAPRGEDVDAGDKAVGEKWVDHDKVERFQQAQSSDKRRGDLELLFKPYLHVKGGCFPYAAVDKEGNHGAGLRPTGDKGSGCRHKDRGQVYARVAFSEGETVGIKGRTAVVFSYYLPKVQEMPEKHRHYYLTVVVWLHSNKCNAEAGDYEIAGVSYSNGGATFDTTSSRRTKYTSSEGGIGAVNTHPVVGYDAGVNVFPWDDETEKPITSPLISWDKLPRAALDQFNGIRYEKARCPFSDANIQATLEAAYDESMYIDLGPGPAGGCGPSPMDPDFAEPKPDFTEPDFTEPDFTEPDVTEPDLNDPSNDPTNPFNNPNIPFGDPIDTSDDTTGTFDDTTGTFDDTTGTFDDTTGTFDDTTGTFDDTTGTFDDTTEPPYGPTMVGPEASRPLRTGDPKAISDTRSGALRTWPVSFKP
ncbi:putative DNA repair protein RAD50 [Colletotrichum shisoi]|uniref:Putative DNA repair protein RAD50 n=1 Tax=Colletotrichum shisoi TaxID=2078593 RepID=A0A5Q4BP77_9PEZI|nr:putative DNA repair protein RAD50 [Colletotrichum shisoi]